MSGKIITIHDSLIIIIGHVDVIVIITQYFTYSKLLINKR